MDLFSRQTLRTLAETQHDPCISLFMPTFRFESDQEQNPIRYKNVLKEAHRMLEANGLREDQIEPLLASARERLEDTMFWRNVSDGLAVFLTPEETRFYRLPLDFEELVVTGERFHLTPLFPLIASNNRFYVLALSQNYVRLYQGTHHAISEVEAKEIPENILQSALRFDDTEEQIQYHTANRAGGREDMAVHGQAAASDDASHRPKDRLNRFFQEVSQGVHEVLGDETAPLVLAGVEYYLPLYREVNDYPYLIEDEIVAGNPEHQHPKELHAKAWEVVEPLFQASQQEAVDQFHQQMGNGNLASSDLNEIIPASIYSRVHTLFVPIGRHRWGHYDTDANAVVLHEDHEPGDEDLLNLATVSAYLNGGTVHALRPENMPDGGEDLAATFRYAADVSASEA